MCIAEVAAAQSRMSLSATLALRRLAAPRTVALVTPGTSTGSLGSVMRRLHRATANACSGAMTWRAAQTDCWTGVASCASCLSLHLCALARKPSFTPSTPLPSCGRDGNTAMFTRPPPAVRSTMARCASTAPSTPEPLPADLNTKRPDCEYWSWLWCLRGRLYVCARGQGMEFPAPLPVSQASCACGASGIVRARGRRAESRGSMCSTSPASPC
jgi:hypothetical protein